MVQRESGDVATPATSIATCARDGATHLWGALGEHGVANPTMTHLPSTVLVAIGVLIVCLVGSFIGAQWLRRRRAANRLAELRQEWGRPKTRHLDTSELEAIRRYHRLQDGERHGATVDEGTWRDLGMEAVYAHLDRTGTFAGRARLYDRLRTPASLASLRRFDEVVTTFQEDTATRERVQVALASVDGAGQASMVEVLFGTLPNSPRIGRIFPVMAVLTLGVMVALIATSGSPAALIPLLVLVAASIVIRFVYARRGFDATHAFGSSNALLDAGRKLAKLQCTPLDPEISATRTAIARLKRFGRATSWFLFETPQTGDPMSDWVSNVISVANALFLLDLIALASGLAFLHAHRQELHAHLALVGDLDAAIAIASFRAGAQQFSRPDLAPRATALEVEDAVHPLLADPVPNSIRIEDRGVLVTGANMSGKSTFVRTVAINALLAQTIYTTLTKRYRAPMLSVRTLMSASDDVQRSRSYYYAELERAKALLEQNEPGTRALIVLDELFRGTNTNERIGAGKAVLKALRDARHFVFASTHDLELVSLLEDAFDPYHFAEDLVTGELVFPYELRKGPSTTRNAIVLMQLTGFPPEVVADATAIVEQLDRGCRE